MQKPMWKYYKARIKFRDRLVGGYPKNADAEAAMLRARGLDDLVPPQLTDEQLAALSDEERKALKDETIQKSATGFKSNGHGPYLESRCIKAMFKECANILKGPQLINIKNFKSKLAERVFIEPGAVLLGQISGTDARVVHVMTAMGPRSSIKFFDYVDQPEIEFKIKVLQDDLIKLDHLRTILEYAQDNGLGADRSQGFGQFDLLELSEA